MTRFWPNKPLFGRLLIGSVIVLLLPFTLWTLAGYATIGGDHGTYTGIDTLAAQLNRLTAGYPTYEHWLGWELGYYLGDSPSTHLIWLPSPEALARSACDGNDRAYFVAPAEESTVWLDALHSLGIPFQQVISGYFELYRIDCTF